ncbi:MAG: nucleotidyltransferase family protein [Gammaproteobacteria bacterium]|nr:nucleotidyltransferase family protein [Gammaproteobacteria bacterium]MBU0787258.1 nucleotidyltransferase family protein [Gammaproteobacteria bacterium]MBU0815998.1 nucleotidyltransferase family protein [Gammaproteobacteria bacterium]MBU1787537.1 nucleotidyltransferase family protein [Gammaproteobacteria bacterium]
MAHTMSTQALILAAGRGERMRPLTDQCPKPLLQVRGKPLIAWHLENLARAGVQDVVINTAWLEEQFAPTLGDGRAFGLRIRYSHEGARFGGALETAGGIATALPLLSDAPFWLVAGDVFIPEFVFPAADAARFASSNALAHIYLVPNPPHNPKGDFGISPSGLALPTDATQFTYSTLGLYRPALFKHTPAGQKAALAPLLRQAMQDGQVTAGLYSGPWTDVGTPERLAELNATR